tara:strand:- start:343 stop:1224 length:882 start_codon:yes stop_codon:yes gene_type:complete
MVFKFQNKRGISIIFNWIFSLIVGVVILSFLIYFAVQNTDLFGKVTAKVVAEELDILFSGYETTKTSSSLDFGREVKLGFECKNGKQSFEVNGKGGTKVWGKIIFAPKEIETNKIKILTESWNVPFRVANFIYIWDENELGDIENFNSLNGVQKDPSRIGNFPCSGNDKQIYYDETSEGDYIGKVCFDKKGEVFYGKALLLGAILTDDYETFSCLNEIAKERFNLMEEVYSEKMGTLVSNGQCGGSYSRFGNPLGRFSNYLNTGFDFVSMEGAVRAMRNANKDLIKGGCAGAY